MSVVTTRRRGPVRLVMAGSLTAVLFVTISVVLLVLATGVVGEAASSVGAIVVFDVLVTVAALVALRLALRLTRPPADRQVVERADAPGSPYGLLAVGLVPAITMALAQAASQGSGLVRFTLHLAAVLAVGVWVVLQEGERLDPR
jgi:hypothetical protein